MDAAWPALLALAQRLVGPDEADDLLQDACLRWVAHGSPGTNPGHVYAYVAQTMRRLLINSRTRPSHEPLDQSPLPIEVVDWMLPMD